jgi:pyruvate kinase
MIRIDEGRIELVVTGREVDPGGSEKRVLFQARVMTGGKVTKGRSVNLPDRDRCTVKSITPKDLEDIKQKFDVDMVVQSFVRAPEDVAVLDAVLQNAYGDCMTAPRVIAKIECKDAVKGIDADDPNDNVYLRIVEHDCTWAVMVGRGDLGGELGISNVPDYQERMLNIANRVGKPVIVATQMFESMLKSPSPTRAEVQDAWSAVWEGADAVMLSGETANSEYAVEAVQQMVKAIGATRLDCETYRRKFADDFVYGGLRQRGEAPEYAVDVIGYPVVKMAEDASSPFIVTYATKGWCARRIARFRPKDPIRILALTLRPNIARMLRLLYSVCPILLGPPQADRNDLPRERRDVMRLSRWVIGQLAAKVRDPKWQQRQSEWWGRFIVATLADELPEYEWDKARDVIVFKCRA